MRLTPPPSRPFQYHVLMYVLTCLVKAGYDLGSGMDMTRLPVKDALEIINRQGGGLGEEVRGEG